MTIDGKEDYRWLESYADVLTGKQVLELGCGSGIDTDVISKMTECLVQGDLKPGTAGSDTTLVLDHSKELPFQSGAFDTVVASLCLHYFKMDKTVEIIKEISRVLKVGGTLVCRLNSYQDKNYGATGYPEIEPGLYNVNGERKRFFQEAGNTTALVTGILIG